MRDRLSYFVLKIQLSNGALLSAASLSFASSIKAQTASSRPADCLEPRLCRVTLTLNIREERLHSASALFPTTGGHYPAPLCLCYGKRAHITTGEELADNYMGWRGAKTHSGQITQATTEGMRGGLIRRGWGGLSDNTHRHRVKLHLLRGACSAPELE